MQATEHNFSSTQRLHQPTSAMSTAEQLELSAEQRWLYQRLWQVPSNRWQLLNRLLRPRFALALFAPTICGALLAIWQHSELPVTTLWPILALLFVGNGTTLLGANLLHEYDDYRSAQRHGHIPMHQPIYATGYHLMATGQIRPEFVMWLGYALLWVGLGCYLGLVVQLGWPLLFFYVTSLVLLVGYSAPPVRYSYWSWGIGEVGVFLGYGLLPLLGSYYVVSHQLTQMALLTAIPFGLAAILLMGIDNFIHHRRDWLMHKRTSVVVAGPNRMLSIHALLTLLIYVALLCVVSLAYLPVIVLVTLGALPLAMRIYNELRGDDIDLGESFLLYRATVTGMLWTMVLFCIALSVDRFVG